MKLRRVICSTGPTSQLTYVIPFIASSPEAQKHTSPPAARQAFYRGRPLRQLCLYFYLQTFPRHKGIGSLPSATNTTCSAPMPVLSTGAKLFGIAQYIPANANALNRISAVLFMGEFSWMQILTAGEVYASTGGYNLWITNNFRIAP